MTNSVLFWLLAVAMFVFAFSFLFRGSVAGLIGMLVSFGLMVLVTTQDDAR